MGDTYTTKEVNELNAYHERRARREEYNKFLEFLDSRYVEEDGRHEWRDHNNDCIDRCKKAFVEQFCINRS